MFGLPVYVFILYYYYNFFNIDYLLNVITYNTIITYQILIASKSLITIILPFQL